MKINPTMNGTSEPAPDMFARIIIGRVATGNPDKKEVRKETEHTPVTVSTGVKRLVLSGDVNLHSVNERRLRGRNRSRHVGRDRELQEATPFLILHPRLT